MRKGLSLLIALASVLAGGATHVVQDQCGPFTDVTPGFCPYILELYYLGITAGTSATTFSPDDPLTRGQGAVFIAKGLNQSLARSSRRAALGQWWTTTPHWDIALGVSAVGSTPTSVVSDGQDVWVSSFADGTVTRVRASDGKPIETWTPGGILTGVVAAMGRVLVLSDFPDYALFMIDPAQSPGAVPIVASPLGTAPQAIAFDGSRLWIANLGGSVSIVTPAATLPWPFQTVTDGFITPTDILYDGKDVWVADQGASTLLRLDASGAVVQTVALDGQPGNPVFDGANIWVPLVSANEVQIIQASTGVILENLSGNGISFPSTAAFDGERVLVTSPNTDSISLWRAADQSPLGSFAAATGSQPLRACSDGVNFWITLEGTGQLARF